MHFGGFEFRKSVFWGYWPQLLYFGGYQIDTAFLSVLWLPRYFLGLCPAMGFMALDRSLHTKHIGSLTSQWHVLYFDSSLIFSRFCTNSTNAAGANFLKAQSVLLPQCNFVYKTCVTSFARLDNNVVCFTAVLCMLRF